MSLFCKLNRVWECGIWYSKCIGAEDCSRFYPISGFNVYHALSSWNQCKFKIESVKSKKTFNISVKFNTHIKDSHLIFP